MSVVPSHSQTWTSKSGALAPFYIPTKLHIEYAVRISARMLVKEAQHQADQAERILKEAVKRIDAECPALSVKLSPLEWDPGDPA
jgi:hypothetical protein